MSTQQSSKSSDDGTDFRALIGILIHHKWVIVVTVAVGIIVSGILSYIVLSPTYRTTLTIALPTATSRDLGLNPQAYAEFAASHRVMATTVHLTGSKLTSGELEDRYTFDLDEEPRLLAVAVSAQTGEDALNLANGWLDAIYRETLTFLEEQIAGKKATVGKALENNLADVTKTELAIGAFDQETPISLMIARISRMESELVEGESRYREVVLSSIPTDQATLAFLKGALEEAPETLSGSLGNIVVPETNPGAGVTSNEITLLNPVYLKLSQDVVSTEAQLATSQEEARTLVDRISALEEEIDQLREKIITSETERSELSRIANETMTLYTPVRSELNDIIEVERQLSDISRPQVVQEPVVPQVPVAPRKGLNIIYAIILASLTGVVIVLFREWYLKPREQVALADSQSAR